MTQDTPRPLPHRAAPCGACPWRVDNEGRRVFDNLVDYAENTVRDSDGYGPAWGSPMFGCHKSSCDELCAGWLAVAGLDHPTVRLALMWQLLPATVLTPKPGWPALHPTYAAMEAANTAALRQCGLIPEET
ncbi:DUF6283 family protein [Nonomuraea sp. NPDC050556]|uniref:DUF6283 family protein n=1 Tax=Nonomuraea sp. NPDC050556 TaxID=3364369 RepID=UPI0037B66A3B